MVELQFQAVGDVQYARHPHHANGNPNKSQWNITLEDEIIVFQRSRSSGWTQDRFTWGIYFQANKVQYLGKATDLTPLIYAKFVDSSRDSRWHGYPADHRNQSDKLPENVSLQWMELLGAPKIRKLLRGQPCKL